MDKLILFGLLCSANALTVSKTCGSVIKTNNTFFVDGNAPWAGSSCTVTVQKLKVFGGICQMRLDMIEFNTLGPDKDGKCSLDNFEITGQHNEVPQICGLNSGQHFYLNVEETEAVQLKMKIGVNNTLRTWKIQVTQIPCGSSRLAPKGCLQYEEEPTGIISSFNYGNPFNTSYPTIYPRSYAICFRDKCQLSLSKAGEFGLTSLPQRAAVTMQGLNRLNLDANCVDPQNVAWTKQKSFLSVDHIKFCGDNFPEIYNSVHKVNQISVVIYSKEEKRASEFYPGFRLRYMIDCGKAYEPQTVPPARHFTVVFPEFSRVQGEQ